MRRWLPGLVLIVGCWRPAAPAKAAWPRMPASVVESSGLAATGRFGTFWTHGDSGTSPVLFEVTATGRVVRTVRIDGASNIDWEDIAPDGQGGVWIGDVGNNSSNRRNLAIHHVPAAALAGEGPARPDRTIRFRYPEQTGFPDATARNFDAEALFVRDGEVYLLTKHRSDTRTVLYRIPTAPTEDPAAVVDAERLAETDVGGADHPYGGMVTGADLHPDGDLLAVLTYHAVLVFPIDGSPATWLSDRAATVRLKGAIMRQTEAIAWDGSGLVLTNEDGTVFRLDDPLAPDRSFP